MDFSEAYRKVVNSGIFVVRNGAPTGVYGLHPSKKFQPSKYSEYPPFDPDIITETNKKSLKQIVEETGAKEPKRVTIDNLAARDVPRALAKDLTEILMRHHVEKYSGIDLSSIIEEGVKADIADDLSRMSDTKKRSIPVDRWVRNLKKEKLKEIQKKMKAKGSAVDAAHLYTPCAETFMTRLGINKDRAYRYTAILLSGAGIDEGEPKQVYIRIKTYISRSKK